MFARGLLQAGHNKRGQSLATPKPSLIMTRFIALALLFWLGTASLPSYAGDESRFALVIGNSAYPDMPLDNPKNDASDIAAALTSLGFQVTTVIDAKKHDMDLALDNFERQIDGAGGVALIYYAGHAMQFQEGNFLFPIDAVLRDRFSVKRELVNVSDAKDALESCGCLKILILDSCRNNPLAARLTSERGYSSRGLAPLTEKMDGMIVSYATRAGDIAEDGKGRNSPYAQALLAELKQPQVPVLDVFLNVQADVMAATKNRQTPEISIPVLSKSERLFFLNRNEGDNNAFANLDFTDLDQLRKFVDRFPNSAKRPLVERKIQALEAADAAMKAQLEADRQRAEKAQQEADRLKAELARQEADRLKAEKAAQQEAERQKAEKAAQQEADRQKAEKAAQQEAERQKAEKAAQQEAERQKAEKAAQQEAERQKAEKAAQQEADRQKAEKAARQEAERQKAEQAAQQKAERQKAEQAAQQEAERQKAEQAALQEAERQKAEKAAQQEAERQKAEKAAQQEAERQKAEQAAQQEAERQKAEKAAQQEAERQKAEKAAQQEADRQKAEQAAQQEADRQKAEQAAQQEADRQKTEQAARQEADRQKAEQAAQQEADRQKTEQAARQEAERQKAEKAAQREAERKKVEQFLREAERKKAEQVQREARRKKEEEQAKKAQLRRQPEAPVRETRRRQPDYAPRYQASNPRPAVREPAPIETAAPSIDSRGTY